MFDFLTPYLQLIKYALGVLAVLFSMYLGYSFEHSRFVDYRSKIDALALAQEAKNKETIKEQTLITKGISDEYAAKLSAINIKYGRLFNSNSVKDATSTNTTTILDGRAAYNILAGQCAQTTLMLVSLQKWELEQLGLE